MIFYYKLRWFVKGKAMLISIFWTFFPPVYWGLFRRKDSSENVDDFFFGVKHDEFK